MEFRVLGQLEVARDGVPVELGAFRQRALLAVLLTKPNSVVSIDRIITAIWGDEAGGDKQNSLWVYVSGLRGALEPDREKRTDGTVLLTRTPGYVLAVESEDLDAARFEELLREGRSLLEVDPAAASLVLAEALAMWRGRAYEDFTYESFFQEEIARLEELRLEAAELRIDADLRRGMAPELISELESLTRQHPLRERLTGQLMVALNRAGRQAEALRAYQTLERRLGDELGIGPSAEVRSIEEQIVTGEATTGPSTRQTGSGASTEPGLAVRGYELREKIGEGAFGVAYRAYQHAVGREVAIKVIRPELADDPTFIRRFEAEARLVARLEHPHIVPLYDYWREPGAAYLVMRLMKGGSLEQVLDASALDSRQALRVAGHIAGALQAAHAGGVVHRDLKPSNVLIDDAGNAYLSDFGIAVGPEGQPPSDVATSLSLPAPYASPEQRANGEVSPASDLYSLGVVLAQALTGLRGDVAQIRGALSAEVVDVIDKATDQITARRYQDAGSFMSDFATALGDEAAAEPVADAANPYMGLQPFDETDSANFFGRERLADRLVYRLSEPGSRGRFLALVGPSGSGKSSVVKAGLLPALAAGAMAGSENWFTVRMVPAPHPFEELETALRTVAIDPPNSLLEQLTATEDGLRRVVATTIPDDGSQLLLVIDQFEELFTQVDSDTAERFIATLVDAVRAESTRIRIVVTLRADFYDKPLRHRALGELLRDGTEVITPMSPEELERAIAGPAERVGVTFEPALIAEIIRDVIDRPSALPLMQYTLTELFANRVTSRIAATAYQELGGVSGALVERAEGLLSGLSAKGKDAARQIFLRLVTLGEGADDTRRRVLEADLEQLPVRRKDLKAVLETFGRHRLLSFDRDPITRGPTVEIAHEALLTEWGRLRSWIDGARHDVRNQRRLAQARQEWIAAGSRDEYLLSGGRLQQLEGWAAGTSLPLSKLEREFLEASVEQRVRTEAEEQEREQRAEAAEEREQQRYRQLLGVGLIALVVGAASVFSFLAWRSAADAQAEAEAALLEAEAARSDAEGSRVVAEDAREQFENLFRVSELVDSSERALGNDPELAVLYAVQAVRETADLGFAQEEAVDALHWALQESGTQYDVPSGNPVAVRPGPNGLFGVFAVQPAVLVRHAENSVSRLLTDTECEPVYQGPCPNSRSLPEDLPLRFGMEAYGARPPGDMALAGTSFTITSDFLEANEGFEAEAEAFFEETGIQVNVETQNPLSLGTGDFERTEVANWYFVPDWAKDAALDLGRFLDLDTLRSDFGDHMLDAVSVSQASSGSASKVAALPFELDADALVIYAKRAFDAAGYEVPTSWEELLAVSNEIVTDGGVPWCVGWGTGIAAGWPGTDLLESVILRSAGTAGYDAWASRQLGFASPEIVDAARLAESILFSPGFVRGGSETVSTSSSGDQFDLLQTRNAITGEDEPGCFMALGADFMLRAGLLPGREIGNDLSFFVLPTPDGNEPAPLTGNASVMWALADRPEVRAFMEFVASPEFGERWAGIDGASIFISPNLRFDLSSYSESDRTDIEVSIALATAVRSAVSAGTWRLDASDWMPLGFASFDSSGPGPFWQGMLDWVDQTRTIEEIFAELDEVWAEIAAAEEQVADSG